jgi:alpha-galactosidase
MGLQLGIYEAIGTITCQKFPGSYGHYPQDAAQFTSWGVDYVKIDACGGWPAGTTESSLAALYNQFGGDLRADNPNALYSQELPVPYIGTSSFIPAVADSSKQSNSWRISADEYGTAQAVIQGNLTADIHLHGYARPGHWNDLDMVLPPTTFPAPSTTAYLSDEQEQLGVWAIEASPLLISTDLTQLSSAELSALGNPDIRQVDGSGAQSALAVIHGHVEALSKPAEGGWAAEFVNTGTGSTSASYTPAQLGISSATVSVRNVWNGNTAASTGSLVIDLPAGGSAMLILHAAS